MSGNIISSSHSAAQGHNNHIWYHTLVFSRSDLQYAHVHAELPLIRTRYPFVAALGSVVSHQLWLAECNQYHILATSVASPTLFGLSSQGELPPFPIAEIPGVTGLLGIAEFEEDVFYVVGSNLPSTENSNGVWRVDIRAFRAAQNGTVIQPASTSMVTRIPSALQLNGMARLASNDIKNLLISDSSHGNVIRLNIDTKAVETVIEEPEMAPLTTGLGIGVNGIRIRDNQLYFVSLDQGLFAGVPISLASGAAVGPVETLASKITFGDDFALSEDGRWAYVATNGPQEIIGVDLFRGERQLLRPRLWLDPHPR